MEAHETYTWLLLVRLKVAPRREAHETMRRALVAEGPGTIVGIQHRPRLQRGHGEVLVRPVYVGLCGTDLELVSGEADPNFVKYPVTLGHEWCGIVEEADPELDCLQVGDHIVAEGIVPCRACHRCGDGASNLCVTYQEIGFTREGAASDHLLVPSFLVHRLDPKAVTMEDAALCEPCAVVQRAIMRAAPKKGSRVLVVGDGAVGLLAVHLVRLTDPSEVVCLGLRKEQIGLARAAGATRFTTEVDEAGSGYDLVIEAAGVPAAVTTAIRAAARGGTVALLGLPPYGTMADVPAVDVVYNDLTIFGSFSYTRAAWASVVSLLNSGHIHPSAIVTHTFPLDEWQRALDTLRGREEGPRGKVLLAVHPVMT